MKDNAGDLQVSRRSSSKSVSSSTMESYVTDTKDYAADKEDQAANQHLPQSWKIM